MGFPTASIEVEHAESYFCGDYRPRPSLSILTTRRDWLRSQAF